MKCMGTAPGACAALSLLYPKTDAGTRGREEKIGRMAKVPGKNSDNKTEEILDKPVKFCYSNGALVLREGRILR